MEEKCLLIESRSKSLEHENDSLRLALRLVAQDRSGDDSHQQDDCWRQVHHSRHTKARRNAHNDLKMSTTQNLCNSQQMERKPRREMSLYFVIPPWILNRMSITSSTERKTIPPITQSSLVIAFSSI